MWAAEAVQDTGSVWFEIIENFRFEDVNGYEEVSWLKVSFAYSQKEKKNRHPGKIHYTLFQQKH